jgi:hypothetical protein
MCRKGVKLLMLCAGGYSLLLFSCHRTHEREPVVMDTTAAIAPRPPEKDPELPDLQVNAAYFDSKTKEAKTLGETDLKKLQVDKLTETTVDPSTANFKILDTLLSSKKGRILMISQQAENEQFAWIVAYNDTGAYMNKTEVFYRDFVEYLLNKESEIKDNRINVKMTTDGNSANCVTIHYDLTPQQSLVRGK